jgi:hypothetical protein
LSYRFSFQAFQNLVLHIIHFTIISHYSSPYQGVLPGKL